MKPRCRETQHGERLHDETLDIWQRRTCRELTPEDAREIAQNATGFFRLLLEWKKSADTTDADPDVDRDQDQVVPTGKRAREKSTCTCDGPET